MNQPKILVVDDDKEIVGAIKKRLEMEDYEIITAYGHHQLGSRPRRLQDGRKAGGAGPGDDLAGYCHPAR